MKSRFHAATHWAATALVAVGFVMTPPVSAQTVSEPPRLPPLSDIRLARLELRDVKLTDALLLISEISGLNAVATPAAGDRKVRLALRDVTARHAIDTLARLNGLWYREDQESGALRLMTTEEFQRDLVVVREAFTRVFYLLHHNTTSMGQVIADLYGDRVTLTIQEEEDDISIGGGAGGSGGGSASAGSANQLTPFSRSGTGGGSTVVRGAGSFGRELELKDALTADQIAELTKRLKTTAEGDPEQTNDVAKDLTKREAPLSVTVIRQHNAVIVRTPDSAVIRDIEKLIRELDRPTPQVLLELKILRLGLGNGFRSIFDFSLVQGQVVAGPASGQPPNPLVPNAQTSPRNVLGGGNFPLEGGTLIYQFLSDQIRGRIQLLEQENRIEVLATPMVLASNSRTARIFVGEQRVLVTGVRTNVVTPATGASFLTVEPITEIRDIGNTLLIQPKINGDRTVTLAISQDSSTVLLDSATIPVATQTGDIREIPIDTVDTATLQGTVVAKDGLTVAVGGLIQTSTSQDIQRVPILGRIPLLGRLFRREVRDKSKRELVLLITPHILMAPAEGQAMTDGRISELSNHPFLDRPHADQEASPGGKP